MSTFWNIWLVPSLLGLIQLLTFTRGSDFHDRVVPPEWTCTRFEYNASNGCDCNCGVYDPDCDRLDDTRESGCYLFTNKGFDAKCTKNSFPDGLCELFGDWSFSIQPENYGTKDGCHCADDIYDPDCDHADQEVFGCAAGQVCTEQTLPNIGVCRSLKEVADCGDKFGDGLGCDCSCRILDPDCLQNNISTDCLTGFQCGTVDPLTVLDDGTKAIHHDSTSACGLMLNNDFERQDQKWLNVYLGCNETMDTTFLSQMDKLESLETVTIYGGLGLGLNEDLTDFIDVGSCRSFSIPGEFFAQLPPSVIELRMYDLTHVTGTIPSQIGLVTKLTNLEITRSNFTGQIPFSIGKLNSLKTFDLSKNKLSGELPISLLELTGLVGQGSKLGGNNFDLLCDCEFLAWFPNFATRFIEDISALGVCSSENEYSDINPVLLTSLPSAPCNIVRFDEVGIKRNPRSFTVPWIYLNEQEKADSITSKDILEKRVLYFNNDEYNLILFTSATQGEEYAAELFIKPFKSIVRDCFSKDNAQFQDIDVECDDFWNNKSTMLGFRIELLDEIGKPIRPQECYFASEFYDDIIEGYKDFEVTFESLIPATKYALVITPFNISYDCTWGQRGLDPMVVGIQSKTLFVSTESDAPDSPPENFMFSRVTSDEIALRWNDPVLPNGVITSFEISCEACPDVYKSKNVVGPPYFVRSLEPNQNYVFEIRARTTAGFGPSTTLMIKTCAEGTEKTETFPTNCVARAGNFLTASGIPVSCDSISDAVNLASCIEEGNTVQTLDIKPGYWRPNISEAEINRCPVLSFCNKQSSVSQADSRRLQTNSSFNSPSEQCSLHHTGTFCYGCEENYALTLFDGCKECTTEEIKSQEMTFFVLVVTVFLCGTIPLLFIYGQTVRKTEGTYLSNLCSSKFDTGSRSKLWDFFSKNLEIVTVKLEIGIAYFQVQIALQTILYLDTANENESRLLEAFSGVDFGLLAGTFGIECVVTLNHYNLLMWYTIPPLVMAMSIVSFYHLFKRCASTIDKTIIKKESVYVLFILSLFVFVGCSKKIFQTFFCQNFDSVTVDYRDIYKSALRVDYTINCSLDAERIAWLVYASIMVLIYPVGISFSYIILLQRYQRSTEGDEIRELARPLVDKYKEKFYWFEVYELLRKLMQTSLVALVLNTTSLDFARVTAQNVSILALGVLLWAHPYKSTYDYMFAIVSLALLTIATQIDSFTDASIDCDTACSRKTKTEFFNSLLGIEIAAFIFITLAEMIYRNKDEYQTFRILSRPIDYVNARVESVRLPPEHDRSIRLPESHKNPIFGKNTPKPPLVHYSGESL